MRSPDREAVRRASPLEVVIPELTGQPMIGEAVERKTRCPWHEDASPSLRAHTGKQTWYCDPCGEGGDVFRFVERHRSCDFKAALAFLAERAGLTNGTMTRTTRTGRIVCAYDYTDEASALLYQSVRKANPKTFYQRRPDGTGGWINDTEGVRLVLYRRPALQGQTTVYIPEGEKDADRLAALGLPATCNVGGAGKWKDEYSRQLVEAGAASVVIFPDNDDPGRAHAEQVATSCRAAGLTAKIVTLPDLPVKGDVSDYLDAGHTVEDLQRLVDAANAGPTQNRMTTLADVDTAFRKWLGAEYDLDALHVVLATAAAERLDGDPLWLLVISGPGHAKTETVQALQGAGAIITSTISSEGALLSGTARREQAKDAHGGLLRKIGDRGLLVVKDVTSILSMNRDTRAGVLAALREVHDGRWDRNVGTDGGRTLSWRGRIVVVGACTTAWDRAHDVISTMGDRFVVVRTDSTCPPGRFAAGRLAMTNTGHEVAMRAELAEVVGGLIAGIDPDARITFSEAEVTRILEAANVVTLARTGVDFDYRGDVIDAHAPEAPTRFAKQLAQVMRGAVAIGVDRAHALQLAIRCARDSMPPIRLAILDDVAVFPNTTVKDVRKRLAKPRATVDRQLQALHMLGVLACDEEEATHRGQSVTRWRYTLAHGIDPDVLNPDSVPDLSPHAHKHTRRERESPHTGTDISGTAQEASAHADDHARY